MSVILAEAPETIHYYDYYYTETRQPALRSSNPVRRCVPALDYASRRDSRATSGELSHNVDQSRGGIARSVAIPDHKERASWNLRSASSRQDSVIPNQCGNTPPTQSKDVSGFLLLTLPDCRVDCGGNVYHGALALECITLADPTKQAESDVWLVLRLGAFETPVPPTQPIVHQRAQGVYTIPGTPAPATLRLPLAAPNTPLREDLDTFEVLLAQYGVVHEAEGGPPAGTVADEKKGEHLKGRLSGKHLITHGTSALSSSMGHRYGADVGDAVRLGGETMRNVGVVYIDARGVGRRALLKRAGKGMVSARLGNKDVVFGADVPPPIPPRLQGAGIKDAVEHNGMHVSG
ncbi:hypothetical protein AURDEDRAFT_124305 [Auricularia subglabra TFB-10046 SS5]|nr:hypothetical protein AURDEDRAFT_124305 [Auricularia subglabra TFB-10046 SS5]